MKSLLKPEVSKAQGKLEKMPQEGAPAASPLGARQSDSEAATALADAGREAARPCQTSPAPAKPTWPS